MTDPAAFLKSKYVLDESGELVEPREVARNPNGEPYSGAIHANSNDGIVIECDENTLVGRSTGEGRGAAEAIGIEAPFLLRDKKLTIDSESLESIPGSPGPPGRRGSLWFAGEGPPPEEPPSEVLGGDFYLNISDGSVWQYRGTKFNLL